MIILFLLFQNELFEPEKILKFADYLYLQEDFNNALNEYQRYVFLSDSNKQEVYEKITDCLVRLNRYDEAIKSTKFFMDSTKIIYTNAYIYFLKGEYNKTRELLSAIAEDQKAKKLMGLSYAAEFDFKKAGEYINLPLPGPSYKNLWLGGLFSLFPGAGHFYCKRIGDGLYSLLVITTGGIVSYYYFKQNEDTKFYISMGITSIFYAGNIYGGINAVRNYNYYENYKYRERIFSEN